jgi:hypothetical protein
LRAAGWYRGAAIRATLWITWLRWRNALPRLLRS